MPNDSFYCTPKWRKTRAEHLGDHPWCCICATIHIETVATEVDHVIAKEICDDPYDHSNLRSLCKPHHSQKTNLLDGANKGKRRFAVVGDDGWPITYREDDYGD